ncbi:hypothetical protein ACTMTJ_25835 [Phytohabitans sp. LJ34]|uniref:hypothetical protein n=1 Tax=Phytohabitans sp. LJ34 TaxID=3452217 RepID=UPI003F8BDD55
MSGEIPYVSRDQIVAQAEKLRDAAIKVKGEMELRYIPRDPDHPARSIVGKSASDYQGHAYAIDENGNYMGTDAHWAELDSQYSWIPDFYGHSIGPEPSGMEQLINTMKSVSSKLYFAPTASPGAAPSAPTDPIGGLLRPTEAALDEWIGAAAVAFRNNFMLKIPDAAQAQAYLAAALAHAVQGNRDMFLAQRVDLLDNATKATTAVEQSNYCNPDTVKNVFTVIGAVATVAAGVAAIPVTGGASLAPAGVATFTIIAGVSSGIGSQDLGKKEDTPLNADTVDGVLSKAVDAVIRISTEISGKEQQMVTALNEMFSVISSGESAKVYLVPRPGVLAMSDSDIKRETDYQGL